MKNNSCLLFFVFFLLCSILPASAAPSAEGARKKPVPPPFVGPDGVVGACVKKKTGSLRLVFSPLLCKSSEEYISWNQQGLNGMSGINGTPGPQGLQGPRGLKGDTGPQGPIGRQGFPGKDGMPGAKGDKGDAGPQGERGLAGPQGVQGLPGIDGAPGAKGDKGDTGPQGPQGERGPAGPQGPQGLSCDASTGSIAGSLSVCAQDSPVAAALVYIPGRSVVAVTDEAGRFLLEHLATGSYTIHTLQGGAATPLAAEIEVFPGETTEVGQLCGCAQGETFCDGACVRLNDNSANCGACGKSCLPGEACSAGMCRGEPPVPSSCLDPDDAAVWQSAGLSPGQPLATIFPNLNAGYPKLAKATALQALSFTGGPGSSGSASLLVRNAINVLLTEVRGEQAPSSTLIEHVNNALRRSRPVMLTLVQQLELRCAVLCSQSGT